MTTLKKISVGVLMGGMSLEKEVSFNSGRTVCDHLDTQKYTILPLFQTSTGELYHIPQKFLYRGKISDFEHRLPHEAERILWHILRYKVDIIFIAQHGRYSEDGRLQGLLEFLHIPYIGSKVFGSALGMDKHLQKIFLELSTIKTPRGIRLYPDQIAHISHDTLSHYGITYPVIVKPAHEGSSFGVTVALTHESLIAAAHKAASIFPTKLQPIIIEEKIEGMEFSCIVTEDADTKRFNALSVTEIVLQNNEPIFDYEKKYMPGRSVKWTPARCSTDDSEKIKNIAQATMKALDFCTIARIDGFLTTTGDVVIIDPNSLSGLAPSSFAFVQAAQQGLNHTAFINKLLETEMKKTTLSHLVTDYSPEPSSFTIVRQSDKTVVAVFLGGESNEREISLESGRNVLYKLSPTLYQAIPIFVSDVHTLHLLPHELLVLNSTAEIQACLHKAQELTLDDIKAQVDFVFIALHGGLGENGSLQGALEFLQIPYNGSGVLASALCMDKYKTAQLLRATGFNTPEQKLIRLDEEQNSDFLASLQLPAIVKPHNDGCSVGVYKVSCQEDIRNALKNLQTGGHTHALIEEYIQGMELTIAVMGNSIVKALPPSATIASHDILSIEEKFLPGAGENQTPAPLTQEATAYVQAEIERAYKTVGCSGYARIDCFYQSKEISPTGTARLVILEINSLPGLTPATVIFHQAAEVGIHPSEFLHTLIQLGLEKHGHKKYRSFNVLLSEHTQKNDDIAVA